MRETLAQGAVAENEGEVVLHERVQYRALYFGYANTRRNTADYTKSQANAAVIAGATGKRFI